MNLVCFFHVLPGACIIEGESMLGGTAAAGGDVADLTTNETDDGGS
eukprot:CAMPEP_0197521230 /NCGR_PEP_ID=MMETSP1318-20131121/6516_1 /TAXON_ID=552666 /ORGANISM="Partenskyella glossopodia, Strain RCC365" /LENGTH=45 /DNA_ID= /DNA_START= /DNA_END= /DNA_ORIENTATION=